MRNRTRLVVKPEDVAGQLESSSKTPSKVLVESARSCIAAAAQTLSKRTCELTSAGNQTDQQLQSTLEVSILCITCAVCDSGFNIS